MEPGQRERCVVVIEARSRPPRRCMALGAVGGESGRYVVRIRSRGEVDPVACVAISRRRRVIVVRVALRAWNRCVLARQRVMRVQGVVEQRVVPIGRVMARSAIVRQCKLHVGWIVAIDEVSRVARVALGRSSRKHIIDMARRALQCRVRTGERITRELQVVELGAHKVVHGVAGLARGGEVEGHVINDRRQEILLVARVASRR
jgi:hypothetical protein